MRAAKGFLTERCELAKYWTAGSSRIVVEDRNGVPRDLSAYVEDIEPWGMAVAYLDVTGLNDAGHRVIPGKQVSQELLIRGVFDDTADTGPDAVLPEIVGQVVTVSYGPAGVQPGQRRISGEFLCLAYRVVSRLGHKVRFEARFIQDGGATLGIWP